MITISTYLHPGIYASSGGGQTRVHYRWATGPRNLLKAIRTLRTHAQEMTDGYGNIGHGASWIEVDGQRLDDLDLDGLDEHDIERLPEQDRRAWLRGERWVCSWAQPPTVKAKTLLDALRTRAAAARIKAAS